MGILKKLQVNYLHKRKYFLIKKYSFYRKDFWGILRWQRYYKYKIILYNLLRKRRRFFNRILFYVYHGINFFNKKYSYKSNLLLYKKCLKFFYGFFYDSYIGRLGRLIKRKNGVRINNFFGLLERRVDVLLYRSLYTKTIRSAYLLILRKILLINNIYCIKPLNFVFIGDIICLVQKPYNFFFFHFTVGKLIKIRFLMFNFYLLLTTLVNFFIIFILIRLKLFILSASVKMENRFSVFNFFSKLEKFVFFWLSSLAFIESKFINKQNIFKNLYKFFDIIKYIFIKKRRNFSNYLKIKYLYGYKNLKIRFKFLYFFLVPSYKNKIKKKKKVKSDKRFNVNVLTKKFFRFWKFSYLTFKYLLKLYNYSFFFMSYPSFLEINYKIHMILIYRLPTLYSLKYPFSIYKQTLYKYFKTKGYF